MQFFKSCLILLFFGAGSLAAKPLLTNSQDTYAKVCLDFDDTFERILQICELALAGQGYSLRQKLDMMESQGHAHLGLEQSDAARRVYLRMLEIDPNAVSALNGIGWVLRNEDEYEAAAASFEASLALVPSAEALAGMASSLFEADIISLDEVLTKLDGSLAIDPGYRWALREKGWVLRDADRFEEAAASFRAALKIEPDDINALSGLARSLRGQNMLDQALKEIGKAIELEPGSADL